MKLFSKLIASAVSATAAITCVSSLSFADESVIRQVYVSTVDELHSALADAQPGDEIILEPGTYQHGEWIGVWAVFHAEADGTSENPIILRSRDPENPAVLSGVTTESKYALQIIGSHWKIQDIVLTNAAKGIFLEQSEYSEITGCEVYNIGDEAIHIIDNSSYNLVENCYIHDTGKYTPKYGEGVYIGSAYSNTEYGFNCHYNTVRNCTIGPNVTADCVDIKEYTIGNVVEYCTFDGSGVCGENGADSFIEVKGNNCIIRNNTGYRNGNEKILYAFDSYCAVDGWARNNQIYENTVYMDTTDCYLFKEYNCSAEVFRNITEPDELPVKSSCTMSVKNFFLKGDSTEDGKLNHEDITRLRDNILESDSSQHISAINSDLSADGVIDCFDMCLLRKTLSTENSDTPVISVEFVEETTAAWRISDGISNKTATFTINAQPGGTVSTGWGYWDPNYQKDDGTLGKWIGNSGGTHVLDENGNAEITVEIPDGVSRVMLEIYNYTVDGNSQDKDNVELITVLVQ